MDNAAECVRVAVNIRPLITSELLIGCSDCITVPPGEPQVQIGSHSFTYDYVYGGNGSPCSTIYDECVAPLVEALFHGYNATVLAYGQTGSGKTYTMGTNYSGEGSSGGVIPKVMETIFKRVDSTKENTEFLIRVSFIEIFKEEVFDLLDTNSVVPPKGEGVNVMKVAAGPARTPIQIRETVSGGITLAGVTEAEVRSTEEMASYLSRGSLARATASTNMNSQSSRSHAIFTITMEQKKNSQHPAELSNSDDFGDDILCAKLHLVDLAGSERAKRTGGDGLRLKEGIHINKGLLALGNVISALGDEKKRKEGGHIPYRDSKLTRLLQDSLGGNSKTVMIACVSPADTNAEETLNTLKYANRARNIQNKAVINRDPMASQMQRMRSQIEQLQTELLFYRSDATVPFDEIQLLKHKVSLLEASNKELQRELQERQVTCQHLSQRALEAQAEKDKLVMQIESSRRGKSWDEIDSNENQDFELIKNYVSKIQELEGELLRLKNSSNPKHGEFVDFPELDDGFCSKTDSAEMSDDVEDQEKELEYSSLQEKLDMELKELDKKLEQKEAEMKHFTAADTSVLKNHFEKKVHELEQEKRALQKEIAELRNNLANISSTSDDGAQKLKQDYLQKLNTLEAQVAELKKKQDAQAQLLRQKQKSDEAAKRLQEEIQRIKTQKVHLHQKIKQESEQFRSWKASREKEVLQLKKEGRRNEYEMHKLLALNQRQKMVLQRKTEEAAMATKRLKELLEARKASSRDTSGTINGNGHGMKALLQAIEHELEVALRVHEVRSEYERQLQERARMANEISKLKEEAAMLKQTNLSQCPSELSPGARNSRIFALENMLASSSSTLVSMASQLSEAEECEKSFSGRGRWNQVRSLVDARNIMNYLLNLASSSRCLSRDKEVECKEKDTEIRDLKEKVVKLSSMARHLERQRAELIHQVKSQNSALKRYSTRCEAENDYQSADGHKYDLRKLGHAPWRSTNIFEDMDTSDSEHSDKDETDAEWEQSRKRLLKKRKSKFGGGSSASETNDRENSKLNVFSEGTTFVMGRTTSGVCCTCSTYSSCKTLRCQCRAARGVCGESCGCVVKRCSNRESAVVNVEESAEMETHDGAGAGPSPDEEDKNRDLASQGAMLLQSALDEKPSLTSDDRGMRRKPLSDIGNTVGKSKVAKGGVQRKKWQRKSVVQLVPVPQLAAKEAEKNEASQKQENANESDAVPLKLPRAMRSLRERNSDHAEESSINKEAGVRPARSPARPPRTSDEKENYGR